MEKIDELLTELDYPSLETVWRGDLALLLGLKNVVESRSRDHRDDAVADQVVEVISRGMASLPDHRMDAALPLEIVVHGRTGSEARIGVDSNGNIVAGGLVDVDRPVRIHCQGDILLKVAYGEVNLAQTTQDGDVRLELDAHSDLRREGALMKGLASLLRAGGHGVEDAA